MEVKYKIHNENLIVYLKNEIDHHMSEKLRTSIDSLIDNADVISLVIDFKSVNFVDSSGIGLILGRYKKMRSIGGKIKIINTTKQIKKILHMASIETIMTVN